jgi:hypothetical protein
MGPGIPAMRTGLKKGRILLALSLALPATGGCGRPDPAAVDPPPSPARFSSLPDNTWVRLETAGTAHARMYSGCCFGGGLLWYFGGAHRGYKGNDVQLFDPCAHAWIQATEPEWPEPGSADWTSMTSGGGRTSRLSPAGRPYTEHTYQQVCWRPYRNRFFVVLVSSGTWEFDPARRAWIHRVNRFENDDGPRGPWAQNHVLYEPALGAPVLICGAGRPGVYRFDDAGRRWIRLGDRPPELAWNEFYSTYVPDWKAHLISTMKRGFFRFDVPALRVTPIRAPGALARCQSLAYDAAARVVIALARRETGRHTATVVPFALDVGTLAWTELDPPKPWPAGQSTGRWAKLWYDADRNVHLFVNDVKRDRQELYDGGVTETWAYRYRRASKGGGEDAH